jgi:hypothetical protein
MKYLKEFTEFNINCNKIFDSTEFNQYQFGIPIAQPLGPGYGWAVDPQKSIYGAQDSPYTDYYSRRTGLVNDLNDVIDWVYKGKKQIGNPKFDHFIDDIENIENLKILRVNENSHWGLIDVFISFEFNKQEYFGVFKDFNRPYQKPEIRTELFDNHQYRYMDKEYKLKFGNYLYKTLSNWFTPSKGYFKNLKENNRVKNRWGKPQNLKKNAIVEVMNEKIDENNNPFLILKHKEQLYYITGNDYYWFKWRFEKMKT